MAQLTAGYRFDYSRHKSDTLTATWFYGGGEVIVSTECRRGLNVQNDISHTRKKSKTQNWEWQLQTIRDSDDDVNRARNTDFAPGFRKELRKRSLEDETL